MKQSTAYFILIVLAVLTPFLAKSLIKLRRKHVLRVLADQLDDHYKIIEELGSLSIKDTQTFFVNFKTGEAEIRMVITGEKGSKFYNIYGSKNRKRRWEITTIH